MDSRAPADPMSLLDLIDAHRWQRLQDHFANVLGVTVRTVSPSRALLATPSWPPHLAADRAIQLLKVGEELEQLLPAQDLPRDTSTLTTSFGVTYAVVPIRPTPDQIIAYFLVGPMIIGQREDEVQFRQRLSTAGLDAQPLWVLLLSLKLYTFAGIRSVLALMEEMGTALSEFAFQARQLSAILPSTGRIDQAVVTDYTERVLHSLLEASTLATRAEGGSIMLFDSASGSYRIQAAQGLSEAVVATTRLRRGEGIAGVAVEARAILLVDDQTRDARIQSRMGRSELTSSLVAPIALSPQQEPLAVLNLRTTHAEMRFTQDHVELLRRLLNLTAAALNGLRLVSAQVPSPSVS